MKKYLALAALLLIGSKAFAQALGYGYPSMPSIHQAAAGGGAAGTASPTASPSPAFITGYAFAAPTANATLTVPTGGATPAVAGDCLVVTLDSTNSTVGLTIGTSTLNGFAVQSTSSGVNWTSGHNQYSFTVPVTPQAVTAGRYTLTGVAQNFGVCAAYYRHVACGYTDAAATQTNGVTTAPTAGSATSTINGDLDVFTTVLNTSSASAEAYTPPSGYTNDEFKAPVNATSTGCSIDHLVQSTAGATTPGAASVTNISAWGAVHYFLQNLGGAK